MTSATRNARRTLLGLVMLIFALAGGMAYNVYVKHLPWAPQLGLDLAGGQEIVLTPSHADNKPVTASDLNLAIDVMRKRINGAGVSEALVTTQGDKILVSIPGVPDAATLALVEKSAQLQFRPVIYAARATTGWNDPLPALSPATDPLASLTDGTKSSYTWITQAVRDRWEALDCSSADSVATILQDGGPPGIAFVTCADNPDGTGSTEKYVLGPVEIYGNDLAKATSGPRTTQGGVKNSYEVFLSFRPHGATLFDQITQRLSQIPYSQTEPRDRFAMVLDGVVISAPTVQVRISGGEAQIYRDTPAMQRAEAELLANELRFGALPISLHEDTSSQVSALLGHDQLIHGLLAGMIGLILVVFYSILQYRALAIVTVGSLAIAGSLTFGSICVLSGLLGYRLSLAGIAGLIVSIGITADSFIVYFERVRDELREGRSLIAAVDHGWEKARRTVFASDTVSLLAAGVLYMTAVGNVRGFAFTLGLTTVIDLIVVTRFTHPMLILLARTRFFGGGHRFSGFDPRLLGRGVTYKGRGRVEVAAQTLAERKAAIERGGR